MVTLSDFSKEARAEASASDRSPISLIHGDHLIELLVDNDIGITRRRVTILELDEAAFAPTVEGGTEEPSSIEASDTGQPLRVRRTRTEKVLSTWPLPGGRLSWKDTLDRMLAFVASEAPSMPDAIKWLIGNYDRVSKEKVARSYWRVLRSFGLIESQGEQLAATAVGAEYLADPTPVRLFALAESNVAGFSDIMAALREGPRTTAELLAYVNDTLGFTWETDAQVRFRLYWLENLGMAKCQGDIWEANKAEDTAGYS